MSNGLIHTDELISYVKVRLIADDETICAIEGADAQSGLPPVVNSYSCQALSIEKDEGYHVVLCIKDEALFLTLLIYEPISNFFDLVSLTFIENAIHKIKACINMREKRIEIGASTLETSVVSG